jgi:hypothetical protein
MATILIVEDDRLLTLVLQRHLTRLGYTVLALRRPLRAASQRFGRITRRSSSWTSAAQAPWTDLQYGTLQRARHALQHQVGEHRAQAAVLQAQVKAFVQEVEDLYGRIDRRNTAYGEEPSA